MEFGLRFADKKTEIAVPLKAVDITGTVVNDFLHVKILQKYVNDVSSNGEFIYTFPIPDTASVCGFKTKIGELSITGKLKEKELACKDYEAAIAKGSSAFLLESFRPNIFQVSLGQIALNEEIEIEIKYIDELKFVDGELRIFVPTLTAPRYIPGNPQGRKTGMGTMSPTDRVPDADFITSPVDFVGYKANIDFSINLNRKITGINSPSHNILIENKKDNTWDVKLKDRQTEMDRDFILLVTAFSEEKPKFIYGKNSDGDYFALAAFTPELPYIEKNGAIDYIFLIDISGSMSGEKLSQAQNALQICLRNLTAKDSFNIGAFRERLYVLSDNRLEFNQKNLDFATDWIENLKADGGTEILKAVKFALNKAPLHNHEKVVMLFTDGEVGNEAEILKYVKSNNNNIRLYSMGIDTSVNSYFINKIAEAGNGASEFVCPGENVADKVIRQFSRVNAAYIDKIKLDFQGTTNIDIAGGLPDKLYDLEASSFIMKFQNKPAGNMSLKGCSDYGEVEISIEGSEEPENIELLEKLWAKTKIEELKNYLDTGNPRRQDSIKKAIVKISESCGIISPETSFVAVYERVNKLSGLPETTVIPVSFPSGWVASGNNYSYKQNVLSFSNQIADDLTFLEDDAVVFNISENKASFFEPSLEIPGFLKNRTSKGSGSANKNIIESDTIKALAAKQNSDGSFGKANEDKYSILIETSKAIITFTSGSEDISLYRGQIKKSVDYLISSEELLFKNEDLTRLAYIGIELCKIRKILRGANLKTILEVSEKLKAYLQKDKKNEEMLTIISNADIIKLKEFFKITCP